MPAISAPPFLCWQPVFCLSSLGVLIGLGLDLLNGGSRPNPHRSAVLGVFGGIERERKRAIERGRQLCIRYIRSGQLCVRRSLVLRSFRTAMEPHNYPHVSLLGSVPTGKKNYSRNARGRGRTKHENTTGGREGGWSLWRSF